MFKKFAIFLGICFLSMSHICAQSADVDFEDKTDPDSKDMDALRRWILDKRFITMREIGGDLSLSGEVRTEFQATNERKDGVQQRSNPAIGKLRAMYEWDVEVNLMLDYRTERTWAAVKIEFDEDMGIRSGTVNKVRLEKGYLGGRMLAGDTLIIDGELGRRNLFNVFDSKVEFSSLFDGGLLRFSKAFDKIGDYYFNLGSFLVNDNTNHYGFVGEMGALGIASTGLNLKFSTINWYRPGGENEDDNTALETGLTNQRYRFLVSQLLAYYQLYPECFGKRLIKIYAAGLRNHFAERSRVVDGVQIIPTGGERANWAWYAGISIGIAKKAGDWAIDANYQWVQAQAYPSFDNLGIGRGNTAGAGFYTVKGDGTGGPTTRKTACGNTNFRGFEIEFLYALTNNIVVQQEFKYSNTLNKNIGPNEKFRQYEIEFIYAF